MKKICCFAGHSQLVDTENIYKKLLSVIENLVTTENVSEFWVGNYGDFDRLCAKAVRELAEKYPEIRLCLIVPYLTREINEYSEMYYEKYDDIIVADMPKKTPQKVKIIRANQYMVENSGFLVCYVNHSFGGAAKTLEYAKKKKHITVINLRTE